MKQARHLQSGHGSRVGVFTRNFFLLWQGQLVSQLGNQAFLIGTTYFVLESTGSAVMVAVTLVAFTAPTVLLGPIAGSVADRHSRRAVLVATDVGRALAIGALGALMIARPEIVASNIALVGVVAVFSGVMAALFTPALQAFIPELVPPERLGAANSLSQMSSQASVLGGQALGGVLYLSWGGGALLLFDAFTFIYAAAATWLIPADRSPTGRRQHIAESLRTYLLEAREGLSHIARRPGMTVLLALFAGVNFLFMPVFVLLPFYTRETLQAGANWYGYVLAGSGAGALAGSALAPAILSRLRDARRTLLICVNGVAGAIVLLAAVTERQVALTAFAVIGALSSIMNVLVITRFQTATPPQLRGRVMAVVIAAASVAVPLRMALGGIIGDLWRESLRGVFAACGGLMVALSLVCARSKGFALVLTEAKAAPESARTLPR